MVGFFGTATPQGRAVKALTITNARTGQTLVDQPPTGRAIPPEFRGLTRTPPTVNGTVTRFLGRGGRPCPSGREQVKFRPHQGALVVAMLSQRPGLAVTASGYGTRNAFGTAVDAEILTTGDQTIPLGGSKKGKK